MGHVTTDEDIETCMRDERELLTPTCRANAARLNELLAEDFVEFGATGRVWDRRGMLAALTNDTNADTDATIADADMSGRVLADGLVLLTYRSSTAQRSALRSSLWRRDADGWRVFFHQGTVVWSGAHEP